MSCLHFCRDIYKVSKACTVFAVLRFSGCGMDRDISLLVINLMRAVIDATAATVASYPSR